MWLRAVMQVGAVCGVLLLPLVCLCQFVPGQTMNGPMLLLLPRAHTPPASAVTLTDDQLADLAFASGQAVSVSDDGSVPFGYGDDAAAPSGVSGVDFQRQGTPLEQNPTLDAVGPPPIAAHLPAGARPLPWRPLAGRPQFQPAPPERPPRLA